MKRLRSAQVIGILVELCTTEKRGYVKIGLNSFGKIIMPLFGSTGL